MSLQRRVPQVLLVDDQPARLLTYETMLEGLPIACIKAVSGVQALERVLRHSFAVIVLDVSMPGMDGFETARMIRAHPRFEQTPIIFVTGQNIDQLDELKGYEAGAIDYIAVPVVPTIFRTKVSLLSELYLRRADLEIVNRELESTRRQLQAEIRRSTALSEAQLRESRQRYRAVFDMPTHYTIVAESIRGEANCITDWHCADANTNALRLMRSASEELIGRRLSEVLPEHAPRLTLLWADVLARRGLHRYETRFREVDFLVHLFAIDDNTIVCSGTDISARVAVEQDVRRLSHAEREEKEWLAAVLNSMTEEVYFTDTRHCYTYANPAALRALGLAGLNGVRVEELAEKLRVQRPDGTARPIEEAPPLRALRGETVCGEEQLVQLSTGTEWSRRMVSSAPVRDKSGVIIGAVSVIRDVTEQRRSQEALKHSELQLREADRRKDEFIATLAHELRNPLVPIRTGIELLKHAAEQPQILDNVQPMMKRQLAHVTRLIDDLLDVSRISSGKIELRLRPVPLSSLVDAAIDATRSNIQSARVELQVEVAEPDRLIEVDPTRMTQVISNLLHNAAKFTPAGGHVRLGAAIESRDIHGTPELLIQISDTGVGISPAMLSRVFELFAQADGSADGKEAGLGIGLAISRRLVELHGGTIHARSDGLDRGAEFTIHLPVRSRSDSAAAAPAALGQELLHADAPASLANIRVLVVDDNQDGAEITAVLLRACQAYVRVVYSGQAALDIFDHFRPTVVLLDIGMAPMDGYETCQRIRSRHGHACRLIAVSGWGQNRDKQRARGAGFDAHLTKPMEPEELNETILRLCRNPRQSDSVSTDASACSRLANGDPGDLN